MRRSSFHSAGAAGAATAVLAFLVAACSGNPVALTPPSTATPTPTPAPSGLAAATSTICVHPSTSAQTVTIPSTGGVTTTLQIGAFSASSASACANITIATGSDVPSADAVRRMSTATTSSRPVLTLSVNEAFPNASAYNPLVVSGATLNVPSLTVFPDGTYYATVTYGPGSVVIVQFQATGGVLTLVNTGSATNPTTITVVPGSTAVIALYGPGVMPALPTPTPTPVITPTPIPIVTPTATAGPTATPALTPTPNPSATATPTATASPFGYNFDLHEGPFTSDCNCQFYGKMVKSVDVVGSDGGNFTVDDEFADGTSITAYYLGSNLRASAAAGSPLQVQNYTDEDNFFSQTSDVDGTTCGDESSYCSVPILYSVGSVQSSFDSQFAAYRKIWGF